MDSKPFVCTVTSPKYTKRQVIISSSFEISGRRRPKFVLTAPAWAPPLKIYFHYWLHWNLKCNFHNFLCSQWRKFRHHGDISVPVAEYVPSYKAFVQVIKNKWKWTVVRQACHVHHTHTEMKFKWNWRNFRHLLQTWRHFHSNGGMCNQVAHTLCSIMNTKIRGCELFWDRHASCSLHTMTLYFHPNGIDSLPDL